MSFINTADFPHPACLYPSLDTIEEKMMTLRPGTRHNVMGDDADTLTGVVTRRLQSQGLRIRSEAARMPPALTASQPLIPTRVRRWPARPCSSR